MTANPQVSPFRFSAQVKAHQGFEAVSALTRDRLQQVALVGTLTLKASASQLTQYPSELRVTLGNTTVGLLTIAGEADNTYWWDKKHALMKNSHLMHDDEPRFLHPSIRARLASHITRDVGYGACTHRVQRRDGTIETNVEIADVARGGLIDFPRKIIACAAGTHSMSLALHDAHLPTTHKRLAVLHADGSRTESPPLPFGVGDRLAMSWCDSLIFHLQEDSRTLLVCAADSFEPLHEITLRAPAEDILFFGGVLWVAEKDEPTIAAYAIPEGSLALAARPNAKPVARRRSPWFANPQPPKMSSFDIGGRTVVRAYVDWKPTLIELPDAEITSLRKKAGDDPALLKKAQGTLRKLNKGKEETPAARRRSFAEAAVSQALRYALGGGPGTIDAAALKAELKVYGSAYKGIAWQNEHGVYLVKKGKLTPVGDAPEPTGELRIAHPADFEKADWDALRTEGLAELQQTARVFRACDLPAHEKTSAYILGTGGGAVTDDAGAAKKLVAGRVFRPNLFADEFMPCFDMVMGGSIARWVMDTEHGGGWLQFRRDDGTAGGGASLRPEEVSPRLFSCAAATVLDVYRADVSKRSLQPAW